jgi:hypothetical protein
MARASRPSGKAHSPRWAIPRPLPGPPRFANCFPREPALGMANCLSRSHLQDRFSVRRFSGASSVACPHHRTPGGTPAIVPGGGIRHSIGPAGAIGFRLRTVPRRSVRGEAPPVPGAPGRFWKPRRGNSPQSSERHPSWMCGSRRGASSCVNSQRSLPCFTSRCPSDEALRAMARMQIVTAESDRKWPRRPRPERGQQEASGTP